MRIFFDGKQVFEDDMYGTVAPVHQWKIVTTLEIPSGTKVVGISCLDSGAYKGIIASFSSGEVTNANPNTKWTCTTNEGEGWAKPTSTAIFTAPVKASQGRKIEGTQN